MDAMCIFFLFIDNTIDYDASQEDEPAQPSTSSEWLILINRGGLIRVDDLLFELFVAMELELRNYLSISNASMFMNENMKELNVLFFWDTISVNWEHSEANELLRLITEHYMTVRGFSFASGFMEVYKITKKKGTQKSKALRKTLD